MNELVKGCFYYSDESIFHYRVNAFRKKIYICGKLVDIYDLFMMGMTPHAIAKALTAEGIRTPAGKEIWRSTTVESILTNEKYKGDALLQKEFTVDFLQKKMKKNEGEVPQYYVENSHPPIIGKDLFDRVQQELIRRKNGRRRYSGQSIYSSRLICGDCGASFGSKVWNSTDQYRRTVWQCNDKFKGTKCATPHIDEKEIQQRFLGAFNALLLDRESLIQDCKLMAKMLLDCSGIDAQIEQLREELEIVEELIRRLAAENAVIPQNQDMYRERHAALVKRYEVVKEKMLDLETQRTERFTKEKTMRAYIERLKMQDGMLEEFDERLWVEVIDCVCIYSKEHWVSRFQDGREIAG